ncbi:putative RNA 3'-terminal phosphate cyclase-like protein [Toxocara canis]|uniref:Putative RNA 3'-terminal phosphate cyclase-like protein n=1 Tax=Toxocara canis TaxID=6265 RepID=A0A0B2VAT8_TOXCA|nr:putative RNA 3'-terminal phosphate cyclase-like protein [Toxocara canis]
MLTGMRGVFEQNCASVVAVDHQHIVLVLWLRCAMETSEEVSFEGCNLMRQRLTYSVLSGRPVTIAQIRAMEDEPGIRGFETKLLSLFEKITNGTKIEIGETGTQIRFVPGMIQGGSVSLDCGNERCLSYFLEPLLMLAPFCKRPLSVRLTGVTNAPGELSVDAIRSTWLPVFKKFVLNNEQLDIKIVSRGLKPDGGGSIILTAPIVRTLRPVQEENAGKVCKIRGMAYVTKVSPSLAHRMIESAKKTLRGYIADVYITVDQRKGATGGSSPGYGLFLTAETTEGVFYHGEAISKPKDEPGNPLIAEDVGHLAACSLLDQIYLGGCLDTSAQALAVTFMTLGEKDVSKYLFGPLSTYCVHTLRNLKRIFEITFKIDEWKKTRKGDEQKLGSEDKAILTCIGVGYSNLNKIVL